MSRRSLLLEKYKIALQKGERFWPDSIYKDLLVSLAIFFVLILLATFIGVPGEPKADPSDAAYIPKPEWYFLFLFKFLALYGQIPVLGKIEWIATVLIPGLALTVLLVLPLIDRNPYRHYSRRVLALTVMGVFLVSVVTLTMLADIPTTTLPAAPVPDRTDHPRPGIRTALRVVAPGKKGCSKDGAHPGLGGGYCRGNDESR